MLLSPTERFWANVDKSDTCWEWTGYFHPYGYGVLYVEGKNILAHRLSWELENGSIPEGMQVLHHCDNPPCVRHDHLFLGTQADNIEDMCEKGRHPNSNKTHCPHGHLYDEDNTYHRDGHRACRNCRQERSRRRGLTLEAGAWYSKTS